jgi:molybdopterin synthase catalytic subunit
MNPPLHGDDWLDVTDQVLPVEAALAWVGRSECGAQVLFSGTVRDHAEGRSGVQSLEYEAYEGPALERMRLLASRARGQWSGLGRIVLLHRTGLLAVQDCAVVVVVSAAHRGEAFEAARWLIDTAKSSLPIWKKETWSEGSDWGTCAQDVVALSGSGEPVVVPRS